MSRAVRVATAAAVMVLAACSTAARDGTGGRQSTEATMEIGSPLRTPAAASDPAAGGRQRPPSERPLARRQPSGSGSAGPACAPMCTGQVAGFDVQDAPEASGLAPSRRDPDLLWVLDDGPRTAGLLAVRRESAPAGAAGVVEVAGLDGIDTEALASGVCSATDREPCLFVGDIGDNLRGRAGVRIHRLPEPDLSHGLPQEPVPAETATFTYPDGATDAEALFTVDGRLFVVSKAVFDEGSRETGPTRLYEAPTFTDGQLIARGVVPVPRPSLPLAANLVGNVVTGADAMADRVVLRTYDHAVLFSRPSGATEAAAGDASRGGADIASFAAWPFDEIPSTGPVQTEAIAFEVRPADAGTATAGGCATLTVGEGDGGIWRTPLTGC